MRARIAVVPLLLLALAACGSDSAEQEEASDPGFASVQPPIPVSPEVVETLRSADCVDVAQFYFEALSSGEYEQAALVWDDPVIDAERLRAVFADFGQPQFSWQKPATQAERGLPVCTVRASLTDAADAEVAPVTGTITFERVPETVAPEGGPSRWQAMEQTFIDRLARSARNS